AWGRRSTESWTTSRPRVDQRIPRDALLQVGDAVATAAAQPLQGDLRADEAKHGLEQDVGFRRGVDHDREVIAALGLERLDQATLVLEGSAEFLRGPTIAARQLLLGVANQERRQAGTNLAERRGLCAHPQVLAEGEVEHRVGRYGVDAADGNDALDVGAGQA